MGTRNTRMAHNGAVRTVVLKHEVTSATLQAETLLAQYGQVRCCPFHFTAPLASLVAGSAALDSFEVVCLLNGWTAVGRSTITASCFLQPISLCVFGEWLLMGELSRKMQLCGV